MSYTKPSFSTAERNGMMAIGGTLGALALGPLGAAAAAYVGHRIDKHLNSRKDRINAALYESECTLVEAIEDPDCSAEDRKRLLAALDWLQSQRV